MPNDEETQALSKFLSELSLTDVDENEISLSSANMPEEFHLVYNRCCKRTQYEISPGFTIILSKERSWRSDAITEETRESVDNYPVTMFSISSMGYIILIPFLGLNS